jgi:hypothetical protein
LFIVLNDIIMGQVLDGSDKCAAGPDLLQFLLLPSDRLLFHVQIFVKDAVDAIGNIP